MLKVGLQNYSGGTAALPHSALEVVCAERYTVTLHYSECFQTGLGTRLHIVMLSAGGGTACSTVCLRFPLQHRITLKLC